MANNLVHFFTEHSFLNIQTDAISYGPVKNFEDTKFRVTSKFIASKDVFAFAVVKSHFFFQEVSGNTNLVNIILKPVNSLRFNGSKIKYFIYKGIKKESIISSGNAIASNIATTSPSYSPTDLVKKLWENKGTNNTPEFNITGLQFTTTNLLANLEVGDNKSMDLFFNSHEQVYQSQTSWLINQGQSIGVFNKDNIGFEIVYGEFDLKFGHARSLETIVEVISYPTANTNQFEKKLQIKNKWQRERILNYIDPCAFYGSFYTTDNLGKVNIDVVLTLNNVISTTTVNSNDFKSGVFDKFLTNKKIYLDIRNQHRHSFNFYLDNDTSYFEIKFTTNSTSNNVLGLVYDTDFRRYQTNDWPILILSTSTFALSNIYDYVNLEITIDKNIDDINKCMFLFLSGNELDSTNKKIIKRIENFKKGYISLIQKTAAVPATQSTPAIPATYKIKFPNSYLKQIGNDIVPNYIGLSSFLRQTSISSPSQMELPSNYFFDNFFKTSDIFNDAGGLNLGFQEPLQLNENHIRKNLNCEIVIEKTTTVYQEDQFAFAGFAKDDYGMYFYSITPDEFITTNNKGENTFLSHLYREFSNAQFIKRTFKVSGQDHFTLWDNSSLTPKASNLVNTNSKTRSIDSLVVIAITQQDATNLKNTITNTNLDKDLPIRLIFHKMPDLTDDRSIIYNKWELSLNGYNSSGVPTLESSNIYFYKEPSLNKRIFFSENYCFNLPTRTKETNKLFQDLWSIQSQGSILFGHQDSLAYGRQFKHSNKDYSKDRSSLPINSDILNALYGKYLPMVFGWDLGSLERKIYSPNAYGNIRNFVCNGVINNNIVEWAKWTQLNSLKVIDSQNNIIDIKSINTFSWHCDNPVATKVKETDVKQIVSDEYLYDTLVGSGIFKKDQNNNNIIKPDYYNDTVNRLINSSVYWSVFEKWLDVLCTFFSQLIDKDGNLLPIIFRPFHEVTNPLHPFFWWHLGNANDFKILWQKTINYLRAKGLNNLLFAFSINDLYKYGDNNTTEANTKNDINSLLSNYYPGDEYVDIICFDAYQRPLYEKSEFQNSLKWHLEAIEEFNVIPDPNAPQNNISRGKLIALSETGVNNINCKNVTDSSVWWTDVLLNALNNKNLAYLLVWRNPYKCGQFPDESEFYAPFIDQIAPPITSQQNNGVVVTVNGKNQKEERSAANFRKLLDSRIKFLKR